MPKWETLINNTEKNIIDADFYYEASEKAVTEHYKSNPNKNVLNLKVKKIE